MSTFYGEYSPASGGGGGGGSGIQSINADTTSAQVIAAGTGISVASSGGTTTVTNTAPVGATGNLTDAGTDGIVITGGTGAVNGTGTAIAQHVADSSHNGYLSQTDWSTFNGKQASLTIGNLTDAGTDGITVTGGTGAVIGSGTSLSQHVSDATHNGYLSSTDWSTFNSKGSGTVTSVTFTGDGTVLSSTPSSAVTTSGTLTAALATQTINKVLAGPTSGGAVAPTFRALVAGDIPTTLTNMVEIDFAGGANNYLYSGSTTSMDLHGTTAVTISVGAGLATYTFNSTAFLFGGKDITSNEANNSQIGWDRSSKAFARPYNMFAAGRLQVGQDTASSTFNGGALYVQQPATVTTAFSSTVNASTTVNLTTGVTGVTNALNIFGKGDFIQLNGLGTIAKITSVNSTSQLTVDTNLGDGVSRAVKLIAPTIADFTDSSSTHYLTIDRSGNINLPQATASLPLFTDASKNVVTQTAAQARAAFGVIRTMQRFTSGSGTYTTPTSPAPLYIEVQMVGGGGGGGASGTGNGGNGGDSTFGNLTASHGVGGGGGASAAPNGGGATIGAGFSGDTTPGGAGGSGGSVAATFLVSGGVGGNSARGGGGAGGFNGAVGGDGATNTGGGGGGGGGGAGNPSASGGSAGGFIRAISGAPSATYSYAVGGGGSTGTGSGANGGAGAAGVIVVWEYYL